MNRKLRQLFCITPILFIISGGSLIAQAAKPAAPAAAVKPVAAPEKAKEPEKKWYDKVNFSGYVDVYYNYTWNNRQGSTQDTQGTFHTYNKQFAVNAVKLAVDKVAEKDSPWGMTLHMQNGQNIMYQERPYQTTNSIYNMQLLQQAYVSYYLPLMKGLVIDAGKMATHIGNEVLDSKDNQAYTIGYIFFNTIPFIHTGARATLTINDSWSAGIYLYNSAQGTGYTANGQQFGFNGTTAVNQNQLFNTAYNQASPTGSVTGNHVYVDGPNPMRSFGTQVKGDVIKDKFKLIWNTLYGDDNNVARKSDNQFYGGQNAATGAVGPQSIPNSPSSFRQDFWFINHISLILMPTDKTTVLLDWTHGERSGQTNTSAFGYPNDGFYIDSNRDGVTDTTGATDLKYRPDGRHVKKVYDTYGIWAKHAFTEMFTLGVRFEYLDDRRYGGNMTVNPALFAVNPQDRYDLQWQTTNLGRPASNYGQIKTLTLTPTFNLGENMLVKVDLRRDYGPGKQFIDQSGRAASGQNGIIIGVVAKF